jgi:hypothetical protein
MNRKRLNAMPALLKFLVPLAIFLLASNANAFTSLSLVARNQVWVNHLTRLQQPMSDPTNEPSTNVGLILNPRMGHVSPQFHVVYDDDFTTVPYLHSIDVPPHWAQLIEASSHLEVQTERQVGTWQSLPELEIDPGDFSSDFSQASNPTIRQDREGEVSEVVPTNVDSPHDATRVTNVDSPHDATRVTNKRVTFSDERDNEIHSVCPITSNSRPNEWRMPDKINLDSSGLRRSACSAV